MATRDGTVSAIRRPVIPASVLAGGSGFLLVWLLAAARLSGSADSVCLAQVRLPLRDDKFSDEKVLVVPVEKAIKREYAERLRRRIQEQLEEDPAFKTVVFQFEEGGGDAEAAKTFASYIAEGDLRRRTTVAWIPTVKKPMGSAVLVVLSCDEIVLGPDAVLRALPDDATARVAAADYDRDFGNALARHARNSGRPTLLARALVNLKHDDILRVAFRLEGEPDPSMWQEGKKQITFMTRGEYQNLGPEKRPLPGETKAVVSGGEPLRLNATQAREWKFSKHRSALEVFDLLVSLSIDVERDNVVSLGGGSLRQSSLAGQKVIDFLNLPIVRILLIVGGCLGFLLELKMPGTFIPGVSGLAFFLVLFVSSVFPTSWSDGVATASYFEVLLFFIGVGLILVELLLLPGVAVFAVGGGALCLLSLVLVMVPPASSSAAGDQMTVQDAIVTLIFGFGLATLAFIMLLKYLPRWSLLGRGGLVNQAAIEGVPTADSALEAQMEIAHLRGKIGVAETMLRPAGKVVLDDGRLLDVVAAGEFIERGERVVITGGSSTRITVARAPASDGEENPD